MLRQNKPNSCSEIGWLDLYLWELNQSLLNTAFSSKFFQEQNESEQTVCPVPTMIGFHFFVIHTPVTWGWKYTYDRDELRCLPQGSERGYEPGLFPTDDQIASCLWDGLNYVRSNGPHIQCYLQIPSELTAQRRSTNLSPLRGHNLCRFSRLILFSRYISSGTHSMFHGFTVRQLQVKYAMRILLFEDFFSLFLRLFVFTWNKIGHLVLK